MCDKKFYTQMRTRFDFGVRAHVYEHNSKLRKRKEKKKRRKRKVGPVHMRDTIGLYKSEPLVTRPQPPKITRKAMMQPKYLNGDTKL